MSGRKAGGGHGAAVVCLMIIWSALVYAQTAAADTITIDSFDLPEPGTEFYVPGKPPWGSGNPFDHKDTAVVGVIGGERDVHVEVIGSAVTISAAGIIGWEPVYEAGIFSLGTGGRAGTFAIADYDGLDGAGLGGIDLTDGGTNNRFRFWFNHVDGGDASTMALTIDVMDQDDNVATAQAAVPESTAAFSFDVPFTDFSGPGMLDNVKSISLTFNEPAAPVPNVDMELNLVEVVPEPATLVMLSALGVLGLVVAVRWCRS